MKNINEILKDLGIEVPENKKAELEKQHKENYKAVADYNKVVEKRDELQNSLSDVQGQLDKFKDVDVEDLKGQISTLTQNLENQKAEYEKQEADRLFNDTITEAIKKAGGRNSKSIKALMDIDKLRDSKNQTEDINSAIEEIKKSDDYLFGSSEPIKNSTAGTGGSGSAGGTDDAFSASLRAAMGLPPEK